MAMPWTGSNPVAAASLTVNDTADRVDSNVGNGECRTSTGTCTLRAAIQEANAFPGPDTITVPAGTYAIAIAPLGEFVVDPNDGDFDITDAVTITGAGSLNTIIDAGTPPSGLAPEVHGLDRLFDVHPTAKTTTITGLTVRDGYTPEDGGAIRFGEFDPAFLPPNPGTLRLVDVSVLDNYAGKYGGGIEVIGRGRVEIVDSTLAGNGSSEGGAAINNRSTGTVVLEDSIVAENPGPVVDDPADPGGIILTDPTDFPIAHGAINNQAETETIGTIVVRRTTVRRQRRQQRRTGDPQQRRRRHRDLRLRLHRQRHRGHRRRGVLGGRHADDRGQRVRGQPGPRRRRHLLRRRRHRRRDPFAASRSPTASSAPTTSRRPAGRSSAMATAS